MNVNWALAENTGGGNLSRDSKIIYSVGSS
jgi:hypothetical protein